jgi:hypothetical protein
MTFHYTMLQSVCGVTQMEVLLRFLGPLFFLRLQNHSGYVALRRHFLTPVRYDRTWASSSGTQHNRSHSKKFCILFRQCFWWRKNKQPIMASSFARSETVWFLRGYIKCTEITLALKTIWKKAFRTLYATFISRTSTCNVYVRRVCASWM